jgi:hypothetical protein
MTRETIKADTFKVDHLLPTMTVEEFGAVELEGAMRREERSKECVVARRRRFCTPARARGAHAAVCARRSAKDRVMRLGELHEAGKEDDVAAFEAATVKAREFEDWKDWNPKGRGNTKRM